MKRSVAAACGMLFASIAFAQSPDVFHGKWKVTWQFPRQSFEANLVLAAEGSTWQTIGGRPSREDPCATRKVPVSLEAKNETQAVLILRFSEVLTGCEDRTVRMNLTSPGAATGRRGSTELVFAKE